MRIVLTLISLTGSGMVGWYLAKDRPPLDRNSLLGLLGFAMAMLPTMFI